MPASASLVAPVTADERGAYQTFLDWVADLIANSNANADRAELARSAVCPKG